MNWFNHGKSTDIHLRFLAEKEREPSQMEMI
jgi:hypothetical protein